MHHPSCHDPAPAGKVRRRRTIFQFGFEHGVWAAGDGDVVGQDYDWRRGWVFPAGAVSLAAGNHGHEPGPAIRLACTSTATVAPGDTSGIAINCGSGGQADLDGSDARVAATIKEEIAATLKSHVRQLSVCSAQTTG